MTMVGLYEYLALSIDTDHVKRIRNEFYTVYKCIIKLSYLRIYKYSTELIIRLTAKLSPITKVWEIVDKTLYDLKNYLDHPKSEVTVDLFGE